jgi:hypothetical protein
MNLKRFEIFFSKFLTFRMIDEPKSLDFKSSRDYILNKSIKHNEFEKKNLAEFKIQNNIDESPPPPWLLNDSEHYCLALTGIFEKKSFKN